MRFTAALLLAFSASQASAFVAPAAPSAVRSSNSALALSGFDISAIAGLDEQVVIPAAGAAVAVVAAAAAALGNTQVESDTQPAPVKNIFQPEPKIDVSIPYDAAAKLAYEAWLAEDTEARGKFNKDGYEAFKTLYYAKASAEATVSRYARELAELKNGPAPKKATAPKAATPAPKKKEAAPAPTKVDLSIPYDAAAKLAFEASDKKMSFEDFKVKYEADAVKDVIRKTKK